MVLISEEHFFGKVNGLSPNVRDFETEIQAQMEEQETQKDKINVYPKMLTALAKL
jgi:hypothetical protein